MIIPCLTEILQDPNHNLFKQKIIILKEVTKLVQLKSEDSLPDDLIWMINQTEIDQVVNKQAEEERLQQIQLKKDIKDKKRKKFIKEAEDKKKRFQKYKDDEQTKPKGGNKNEDKQEMQKINKEIKSQLKETEVDIEKKVVVKYNAEILSKLVYIYFKILKTQKVSKFLKHVLSGILKFINQINIDLIWDVIKTLKNYCQFLRLHHLKSFKVGEQKHDFISLRLSILFTLQEIIVKGPGQLFEMNDKETLMIFYQLFIDIGEQKLFENIQQNDQITMIKLLEQIFLIQREFSIELVGSFLKIISSTILKINQDHRFLISILFVIMKIIQKYPRTQKMLEKDNEGLGLNSYNPKLDDPQVTNAINSNIYEELQYVVNNCKSQEVISLAKKLINNERLNANVSSLQPHQYYQKYQYLLNSQNDHSNKPQYQSTKKQSKSKDHQKSVDQQLNSTEQKPTDQQQQSKDLSKSDEFSKKHLISKRQKKLDKQNKKKQIQLNEQRKQENKQNNVPQIKKQIQKT